jgi:hypothetical protein
MIIGNKSCSEVNIPALFRGEIKYAGCVRFYFLSRKGAVFL